MVKCSIREPTIPDEQKIIVSETKVPLPRCLNVNGEWCDHER